MKLFLHLTIAEEIPIFNSKWHAWTKKNIPNTQYFDLDQQSDMLVIDTAIKAIAEADRLFVYINYDSSQPGQLLKVIKKLSTLECKICCIGNNTMLDKLSKVFGARWQSNMTNSEVEQEAKEYFTT